MAYLIKRTLALIGNQFDILTLSETWLSPDKIFLLNNYHILRKDGPSNKSGGVLLAIKSSIHFTKLDSIFSSDGILEAVGVKVPSSQYDIYIISIYRHPSSSLLPKWEDLFNSIPSSDKSSLQATSTLIILSGVATDLIPLVLHYLTPLKISLFSLSMMAPPHLFPTPLALHQS